MAAAALKKAEEDAAREKREAEVAEAAAAVARAAADAAEGLALTLINQLVPNPIRNLSIPLPVLCPTIYSSDPLSGYSFINYAISPTFESP